MRLGIYGGSFDPIHFGHLLLAEHCREACRLDEVWFLPTGQPPHKRGVELSPGKARREMIEFAIAGYPVFRVSTMELDRPGPHYTVDTLRSLKESHPADELFLLIGGDSLAEFATWRAPEEICRLATVAAVNRGRTVLDASSVALKLGAEAANRIQKVSMPAIDLSASDIRRRVAAGQSIRFQTPRPVEQYILQHELYRSETKPGAGA